ncbi:MAG: hypothetical protein HYZ18_03050, partial [Pseudogulbenkiania sp.]|nr:hypothetical protein [Pseudogulbenkiania sp.]
DAAGNAGSGSTESNNYAIDTARPTATLVVADTALKAGETSLVTIIFSEAVSGFSNADLSVANGTLSAVSSSDGGVTWSATLTPSASVEDSSNVIRLDNSGVSDAAGNAGSGSTESGAYAIDTTAPTVTHVGVPADARYVAGQPIDFTVNFSEAVVVDAGGGTPRLAVTLDSGGALYADYLSGSGGNALTFRLTVASGQLDSNGIVLAACLDLNGGTIRDAVGNDAVTALNSVGATTGVLVDAVLPAATAIARVDASPTNNSSASYTVTFSEDVSGVDASDFSVLASGSAAGRISRVTQIDGHTYVVAISDIGGSGTLRLDLNGSGITDAAGNEVADTLAGETYAVLPPVVTPDPVVVSGTDAAGITAPVIGSDPIDLGPITPNIVLAALNEGSSSPLSASAPAAGTLSTISVGGEPISVAGRVEIVLPGSASSAAPVMPSPLLQVDVSQPQPIEVRQPQVNQALMSGQSFGFALPSGIFSVSSAATSSRIEVRQSNGRPLPSWMRFDPTSGTFSGQAPVGQRQPLELTITIRDAKGNVGVSRMKVDFGDIQGVLERPVGKLVGAAGQLALAEQFDRYGQPDFERGVNALLGVSAKRPAVG